MDFQQAVLAFCGTAVAYILYQRYRDLTIRDVPGPKNPSWVHGIFGSHTLFDSISLELEQDTNGTGNAERRTRSKSAF